MADLKLSRSHLSLFSWAPATVCRFISLVCFAIGWLFSLAYIPMALSRIFKALAQRMTIRPRADDIYIVSYPRSGTTWMQMILYQITTSGEMDMTHISQFVPFLERAPRNRRDLEELPSPRVFKTHLTAKQMNPRAGRYIYIERNVKDVVVSDYYLYVAQRRYDGGFDRFFEKFVTGHVVYGSWWRHVEGWKARQGDPNILFLRYEDLKFNLEPTIRRILTFLDIELTAEAMQRVLERSQFAFMKAHEGKFETWNEMLWEQGYVSGAFIREGRSEAGRSHLSEAQARRLEALSVSEPTNPGLVQTSPAE